MKRVLCYFSYRIVVINAKREKHATCGRLGVFHPPSSRQGMGTLRCSDYAARADSVEAISAQVCLCVCPGAWWQ